MVIAQLHSRVTGHVAAKFFLIHGAIHVAQIDIVSHIPVGRIVVISLALGSHGGLQNVTGGHVQSHELHVGIQGSGFHDGAAERVTGHHDDVIAIGHSGVHHCHTLGGGVTGGLVVVELYAVVVAERLACLVSSLVEGLVGNVTVIGDHGHAIVRGSRCAAGRGGGARSGRAAAVAAGGQRRGHDQCQCQCKKLLHWNQTFFQNFG
ncbi:hypothetical protein DSECCO2_111390 [anaerobic digester metagenome]